MKEAETKKADGVEYHYLIHNYLCQLFLEDHKEEEFVKNDFAKKQEQIHKNFTDQFNKYVDPFRHEEHAGRQFKKLFPEPKPRGDNQEEFENLYEIYEKWVRD